MCTDTANEVAFYVGSPSNLLTLQVGASVTQTGGSTVNDGAWHHVALVYNRTAQTATAYLDGAQQWQATSQNWTFSSNSKVVYFNGRTLSSFGRWTGLADEIKLDNTARNPTAFVMPSPGGGGGDGGDDESCSTSAGRSHLWLLSVFFLLFVAVRIGRHREA